MHIVGVHGIWQGNTNAVKLSADWGGALARGLRRYHGAHCPIPPLTVSHYGRLFRTPAQHLGPSADETWIDEVPVTDEEEAFIFDTLDPYLPGDVDTASLSVDTLGLGVPYVPRHLAQVLVAVDQKAGRGTGRWLLRMIRQVYRYLHDNEGYGSPIRDLVAEELHRPGPRVVIAHSLGSVIAFDMLTRKDIGPGPDGLQHLVTCGSPLAWPTIRRALGHDGLLQIPQGIEWLNLHAAGDVVAQSRGLAHVAPDVHDEAVHNGVAEPHSAVRYLAQQPLADLIAKTATG
ncbi:hypothetical protein ACIP79_41050 [Streptomyces sp. NPDC088747]|uniref:hypothetical protein n=1 Tax=Streptomyces sp. NPDC088747 TaxID=3365886 RepID=UPI0037FA9ABD